MERTDSEKKYFVWILMAALVLIAYFLIESFIISLITGFVLAYLMLPIFNFLNKKKIPKRLSAFICVLIVILIVLIPLGGIVTGITLQANQIITSENLQKITEFITSIPFLENLDIDWQQLTKAVVNLIIDLLTRTAKSLPTFLLSVFIILAGVYYILLDWEKLSKQLKKMIPFKDKDEIAKEISKATKDIIYGTVLVSIIGFIVSVIGLYLIGVDQYLFYSAIMAFLLFIPLLGPALLWIPLTIYYFINQQTTLAIGMLIVGLVLSNIVDNIIRMKILGSKARINPLIMLVGIVGGIAMFGIFGFIIGPLILVYTIKILQEVLD